MSCGWRSDLTIIWALRADTVVQCEYNTVVTVSVMDKCL